MPTVVQQRSQMFKRADLHCHSLASTEADEAMLQAISCPESYSEPAEIHAQAKERGMDFVTITDHDSIAGVQQLAGMPDVLVGEELTCYFPEDHCKIHLLLWGITPADHAALQASANDIYEVARFVAENQIAHAVAHPLYRQNGVLDVPHIERLLLLFKGFECLNGAHSLTHRKVFEPILNELDELELCRLENAYGFDAYWPKPWEKSRTAGSDDHGLFNIGRTWTQFPPEVSNASDLLDCLRECRCQPGGEAGSSIKLAHNFFSVGMRHYTRKLSTSSRSFKTAIMRKMLGEKPQCGRISMASGAIAIGARSMLGRIGRKLRLTKPARGTDLLQQLISASALKHFDRRGTLAERLKQGRAPMAEHQPVFDFICKIDRDVTAGVVEGLMNDLGAGRVGALFDSLSTVAGHQAILLPYYFALFHQNQERDLLNKLSRDSRSISSLRVGLFTDSAGADTAAGRFAADFARYAGVQGLQGTVHSVCKPPEPAPNRWRTFEPMVERGLKPLPFKLVVPPVLEILEWADRQQFDAILINTCGPMGLCGWLAAKMLRAPVLTMCHEDIPARVLAMTGGDYRLGDATRSYVQWLNRSAARVLVATRAGRDAAEKMSKVRVQRLTPGNAAAAAWKACFLASLGADSAPYGGRPALRHNSSDSMEAVTQ